MRVRHEGPRSNRVMSKKGEAKIFPLRPKAMPTPPLPTPSLMGMAPRPPVDPGLSTTPKAAPMSPGIHAQNTTSGMGEPGSCHAQDFLGANEIQAAELLVQQQMAQQAAHVAMQEWMMQQHMLQQAGAPVHPTYAQLLAQQHMMIGAAAPQVMAQPMMAQAQPAQAQPVQAQQAQPVQPQPPQAHLHPAFATADVATTQLKVPEPASPPTEFPQPSQVKTPAGSQNAQPIPEDGPEYWGYGSRSDWTNWTNWKNYESKWEDQKWSGQGYDQSWKSWKSWNTWEDGDYEDNKTYDSQWKESEEQEPEPEENIQKFSVILDQYTANFQCPFSDDWIWIRMRKPPPAVSPHVVPAKRKVEMENWEETEDVNVEED